MLPHLDRIELLETVTALGHTHNPGDQGHIESYDPATNDLIVRMDDGNLQFPHPNQVRALTNGDDQ